tara:strand:- start:6207 stop:7127 length:921 start_codon:yes stop_codon:yes gene_type:complete
MDPASDLFLFNKIVKNGSFAAAADQLNMTPSGVSKRLSRFENRLEVRLFNRTTRTLSLTESGQALYDRAQSILEAIEDAETQTRELSRIPRGKLRVACSDAFAVHVIVPMLAEFNRQYPEVAVTLVQGDGPLNIVEAQIDLAIRFIRPTNPDFVAKRLVADPWVVCASPAYLSKYGAPKTPDELHEHRCLTIKAKNEETNQWYFDHPQSTITVDGAFSGIGLVVKAAALQGLGIARLASFLVQKELQNGDLVQVLDEYMPTDERCIYAVYPHRDYLPLKIRVFIDTLERLQFPTSLPDTDLAESSD